MREKAMKPYIRTLIPAVGLYIALPSILLLFQFVTIASDARGVVLVIVLIFLYFHSISTIFIPGICAIYDLRAKKFVTSKVVHTTSYVNDSFYSFTNRRRVDTGSLVSEYVFIRAFCKTNSGKSLILSSALNHKMENQRSYIVTYGRFSKIIVSVMLEEGQELLV